MNVSAVGNTVAAPPQAVQRVPESAEVNKGGNDADGDSDDSGAKAVQAAPKPTVNTSGQPIGQRINVTA